MNKLLILILIMLFLAFVPLGPIDYSSGLSGAFIFLGEFQMMLLNIFTMIISNVYILSISLMNNALPILVKLYETILSLPYDQINYWYILLGLLIVGYFKEKFRTINNELNKLRKRMSNSREKDRADYKSDSAEQINMLNQKATAILEMLSEISNATESFKNNYVRTKKIRRVNVEAMSVNTNLSKVASSKDEEQLMRLRKDQTLQENKVDVVTDVNNNDIQDTHLS